MMEGEVSPTIGGKCNDRMGRDDSNDGRRGKSNDGREEVSLMIEDKYMWECNQDKNLKS